MKAFFMLEYIHKKFLESGGICTDTRKLKHGEIFVALSGANFDGNVFARRALELGAVLAVVDNPDHAINDNIVYVPDCLSFLQELANFHRNTFDIPVIAITGSNGKTTTKELISYALSKKYNVLHTKGNLNNHIGVPLTLLRFNKNHDIAVVEMGANHQKEIELLAKITNPTHGFITNIGFAHLEGFGGVEGVLKGKMELYHFLNNHDRIIFYNSKDRRINALIENFEKTVPVSESIEPFENSSESLSFSLENILYNTNLVGNYNIYNLRSAFTIAQYFGVNKIDIIQSFNSYLPNMNRSQLTDWNEHKLILDAYNANPSSVRSSIESFDHLNHTHKVLVLGDMLELGDIGIEFHLDILKSIVSLDFALVICIGSQYKAASSTMNFPNHFKFCENKENAIEHLNGINENSLVLVKGSRGMQLELLFK